MCIRDSCVVLYVVVAIVYDSNKDFDMLASYIEYASTHEVNEEYRNSLLAATDVYKRQPVHCVDW